MHISAEMRSGELKIGDEYVDNIRRIATADHPKVLAIAEKYQDRPGLEPERWLQTPPWGFAGNLDTDLPSFEGRGSQ